MKIRNAFSLGLTVLAIAACGGDEPETASAVDDAPIVPEAPVAAPAAPAATGPAQPAVAMMTNRQGQEVGQVTFTQEGSEVVISVNGRNFEGGQRAIHIHDVGRCDGPTFDSAGGHFNPGNTSHGLNNPAGPHAGDLPNLIVDPDDGLAHDTFRSDRVTLRAGEANSLLGGDGTAIVIHAGPDDNTSQPSGNSGDRVACGVITAA